MAMVLLLIPANSYGMYRPHRVCVPHLRMGSLHCAYSFEGGQRPPFGEIDLLRPDKALADRLRSLEHLIPMRTY